MIITYQPQLKTKQNKDKKNIRILITLFFAVVLAKFLSIIFFNYGPQISPDEICILETAKYFAEYFKVVECKDILNGPYFSPPIFHTIAYGFIAHIVDNINLYKAVSIFNLLLGISTIFPLYYIAKYITKKNTLSLGIALIIFIAPQFFTYEKTVMTEMSFLTTCLWTLSFYIKSLEKGQTKHKIISIILSILAVFMRPYGFILPLSILANEFFRSKRKLILTLIGTILVVIAMKVEPAILDSILSFSSAFQSPENLMALVSSILKSINSLSIATLSLPLIILITNFKSTNKNFHKIKYFVFIFIILNLIIVTNHLFGHQIRHNISLGISMRYLSVSVVLTLLLGISLLFEKGSHNFKKGGVITCITIFGMLFLFNDKPYRISMIEELSHIYIPLLDPFFPKAFGLTALFLITLHLFEKKQILLYCIAAILLFHTVAGSVVIFNQKYGYYPDNPFFQNFD